MIMELIESLMFQIFEKFENRRKRFKKRYYQNRFKGRLAHFGEMTQINGELNVIYAQGLFLGDNVHVGAGGHIDARGGVIIGSHTHISRNVTIYSTNHNANGDLVPYDDTFLSRSVVIKEGVWIGMNVSITPGVTIGKGAIIGMGTVVSKNVEAGEILVSNQQRKVGERDLGSFDYKMNRGLVGTKSGEPAGEKMERRLEIEQLVFVLSTGRAGSNSIAESFHGSEEVLGLHEPFYPCFRKLVSDYFHGYVSKNEVKTYIKDSIDRLIFLNKKVVLVSDQKLVPFIDELRELYPAAKFIWLIRHPKKFAISAAARGWFSDNDISKTTGKETILIPKMVSDGMRGWLPKVSDKTREDIEALSLFDRNVLYWNSWNLMIKKGLNSVSEDLKLEIKLEEIQSSSKLVQDFLGLERKVEIVKSNLVKKKDLENYVDLRAANQEVNWNLIDDSLRIKFYDGT